MRKFDESGERRDGITFIIGEREGDAVSVGAPSLKSGIFNQKAEPASEGGREREGGREGEGEREGGREGGPSDICMLRRT